MCSNLNYVWHTRDTSMQNNSFLFIAIIVITRVITMPIPALETCVTLTLLCPMFVCP